MTSTPDAATLSAIQIGLDPAVIDYDSPDFAAWPDLDEDMLRDAMNGNVEELRRAGIDADACPIDLGETALEQVRAMVAAKSYDAVLIGAGVRLVASNTLLFEAIVNTVHAALPECRFVFNAEPLVAPEDIYRWFPRPS